MVINNLTRFWLQYYFDIKEQKAILREELIEFKYNPSPELLTNICANLDYHEIAYTLPLDIELTLKKL